jgi:hypothetical protein
MFTNKKDPDYNKISLNDFSDDSSSGDEEYGRGIPNRSRNNNNNRNDHGAEQEDDFVNNTGSLSSTSTSSSPMHRQQQLMQQQDQGLEMLAQSAERLGTLSMAIHDELGQQNKMLEEMDQDLDEAQEHLGYVTRKTKEVSIETSILYACVSFWTLHSHRTLSLPLSLFLCLSRAYTHPHDVCGFTICTF